MSYDDYYTNADWAHDNGYISEEDIPPLDICAELINEAQDALYISGDLDALENALDELRGQFDLVSKMKYSEKLPQPKLAKAEKKETLFTRFAELTRSYARSLTN